jgi:hypothetical protein
MIITTRQTYAAMSDEQRLTRMNKLEMDNANLLFRLQEIDGSAANLRQGAEVKRLMAVGRAATEARPL